MGSEAGTAGASAGRAAFLLLLDEPTQEQQAQRYARLVTELASDCAEVVGFTPEVAWLPLPAQGLRMGRPMPIAPDASGVLERVAAWASAGVSAVFALPVSFDFGIEQKQWLAAQAREVQRYQPELAFHYDRPESSHPLLLQALVDAVCRELAALELRAPSELGLLLVAAGAGDADTRADSYRVMRLLWEQIGASRADVAFVRHPVPPLPEQLAASARSGLTWLCQPQFLWPADQLDYARVIFDDSVAQFGVSGWRFGPALSEHPNLRAWLKQRAVELYRQRRERLESRIRSAKHHASASRVFGVSQHVPVAEWRPEASAQRIFGVVLAEVGTSKDLGVLLEGLGMEGERTLVKPTWHGYATGTYTDPVALEMLLSALPTKAVVLEGHTVSRSRESADFDWEVAAREHRAWIRRQEQLYLEKTGLRDTLHRHAASYLNVTECWWDDGCANPAQVEAYLKERGVTLSFPELLQYVPEVLFEARGASMVSFARFKGPTRLAISNLFGLLPQPLRAAWHGPNISYFAEVCCDLAKLYGTLFQLYAVVESLSFAVRWEPRGLYRSRWGNYDLIESPGIVCLSRGLAAADVIAARLQGQDVTKSAFFDVVRERLGFDAELARVPLPDALVRRFV